MKSEMMMTGAIAGWADVMVRSIRRWVKMREVPGEEGKWGGCREKRQRAKSGRLDILTAVVVIIFVILILIFIIMIIQIIMITCPFSIASRQESAGKLLQELVVVVGEQEEEESLPWSKIIVVPTESLEAFEPGRGTLLCGREGIARHHQHRPQPAAWKKIRGTSTGHLFKLSC